MKEVLKSIYPASNWDTMTLNSPSTQMVNLSSVMLTASTWRDT